MDWLPWAPLAAAYLHITEEFIFPGGFPAWYRRYRADPSRITRRFLVIINVGLLVTCGEIGIIGGTPLGVGAWLVIMALLASNGCWHAWASYKTRSYSPGVITGMGVYLPLAVYGYTRFIGSGAASIATAAVAVVIGGSYHLWSSAYHGRSQKPN
jgi:hypothetical protein